MLQQLILSYLAGTGVQALPIMAIDQAASPSESCDNLHHCRTIWNIIWSCLITIFTCTWVAIHPNVPAREETWATITYRRVRIVLVALIAPEFIIFWAMRQRLAARGSVKNMKNVKKRTRSKRVEKLQWQEWTLVHGFLASMGGFIFQVGPERFHPLDTMSIAFLIQNNYIDFPIITEEEARDKSKGDGLSKGLVVLQTGWFVLQCIARGVERLPVTELEIVTLAFATLNLITYALWWNKPLQVQCSVPVKLKKSMTEADWDRMNARFRRLRSPGDDGSFEGSLKYPVHTWSEGIKEWVNMIPGLLFGAQDFDTDLITMTRVPTYYAGRPERSQVFLAACVSAFAGMVFGAIHCIAWSFPFSTRPQRILWRTSSIVMICIPILLLLIMSVVYILKYFQGSGSFGVLLVLATFLCMFVYFVARFVLLVQAFSALRSLPPGMYQTIYWTTFIPHF